MTVSIAQQKRTKSETIIRRKARSLLKTYLTMVRKQLYMAHRRPKRAAEAIHQVRVFTRRASEVLEVFSEVVPLKHRRWFTKNLARIRRAAGKPRDLDVLRSRYDHPDEGCLKISKVNKLLLKIIDRQRKTAIHPLEVQYKNLIRSQVFMKRQRQLFKKLLDGCRQNTVADSFHDFAVRKLAAVVENFFTAGQLLENLEQVHRFRLQAKKLRYVLTILSPAFPPNCFQDAEKLISRFQERLGEINDCVFACESLEKWAKRNHGHRAKKLQSQYKRERAQLQQLLLRLEEFWNPNTAAMLQQSFAQRLSS